MKGIGYRECAAFLAGELAEEDLAEAIAKATRHFAKRQMTWYKKMPYITWFSADRECDALADEILAAAHNFWRL